MTGAPVPMLVAFGDGSRSVGVTLASGLDGWSCCASGGHGELLKESVRHLGWAKGRVPTVVRDVDGI